MAAVDVDSKERAPKRARKPHVYDEPDEHTLRILVATDNHLGYLEKDPIRGEDSFRSFEEIFQIAVERKVDFLLLGGDIFHENKPSRNTMLRAAQIFRKYCLGDRPVKFNIVSDPAVNFPDNAGVNYEDPNINIALPVFCIHGNHDDPAGSGKKSAIDLLSTTSLINYFGKANDLESVEVTPILIEKGTTKLALYGLGNIRDERLHRIFRDKKLRWLKPPEDTGPNFNIFVIHQNRTKHSSYQKNYINESMLPQFLDLVIWAHEHESLVEPEESVAGGFNVCQPGSSVATSLSDGEARKKKIGVLEIRGGDYRIIPVELRTVRPFIFEDIRLSDIDGLSDAPDQLQEITHILESKVNEMIHIATSELTDEEKKQPQNLPLIRLRVDFTGFSKISAQRFAGPFVGKVANPEEILLWQKKRVALKRAHGSAAADAAAEAYVADVIEAEQAPEIHELISKFLTDASLSVLTERGMADAIREYVDKQETGAITSFIDASLKSTIKDLFENDRGVASKDDVEAAILAHAERQRVLERADAADGKDPAARAAEGKSAGRSRARPAPAAAGSRHHHHHDDDVDAHAADAMDVDDGFDMDVDAEFDEDAKVEPAAAPAASKARKAAAPRAASTRGRGRKASAAAAPAAGKRRSRADSDEAELEDADSVKSDSDVEALPSRGRGAARARGRATAARVKAAPAPARAAAASAARGRRGPVYEVVDVDADEDGDRDVLDDALEDEIMASDDDRPAASPARPAAAVGKTTASRTVALGAGGRLVAGPSASAAKKPRL